MQRLICIARLRSSGKAQSQRESGHASSLRPRSPGVICDYSHTRRVEQLLLLFVVSGRVFPALGLPRKPPNSDNSLFIIWCKPLYHAIVD